MKATFKKTEPAMHQGPVIFSVHDGDDAVKLALPVLVIPLFVFDYKYPLSSFQQLLQAAHWKD
jgi:hypothetical protein